MLTSPPSYAGQSEIANLKTPFNASFQLLLKTNVGPGIEELQSIRSWPTPD
ncbi:mCG21292, isoform CRA_a [Mus musculus]|nr:mCG21292, isoform CRA_a [Mus musculus]